MALPPVESIVQFYRAPTFVDHEDKTLLVGEYMYDARTLRILRTLPRHRVVHVRTTISRDMTECTHELVEVREPVARALRQLLDHRDKYRSDGYVYLREDDNPLNAEFFEGLQPEEMQLFVNLHDPTHVCTWTALPATIIRTVTTEPTAP